MKRLFTGLLLAAMMMMAAAPAASADDHDLNGVSVKIDNTIESQAVGFPEETPFGSQGPVAINATIEFAECCDGFYEVDLTENQISMRWIGEDSFARVIEDGTFDRYYFTFGEPVLAGATLAPSSTLPVEITVVSATEMIVEVGPGMQIGDGFDALIDLTLVGVGPSELAFTGAYSWQIALGGLAAIAVGAGLVAMERKQ